MEFKRFTYEQHIKKHTLKENTHCFECAFCELGNYNGTKYYKDKFDREN